MSGAWKMARKKIKWNHKFPLICDWSKSYEGRKYVLLLAACYWSIRNNHQRCKKRKWTKKEQQLKLSFSMNIYDGAFEMPSKQRQTLKLLNYFSYIFIYILFSNLKNIIVYMSSCSYDFFKIYIYSVWPQWVSGPWYSHQCSSLWRQLPARQLHLCGVWGRFH